MRLLSLLVVIALLTYPVAAAPEAIHVAPWGNDGSAGSERAPFRTIQHAADTIAPGQTCVIHEGRYRETVHLKGSGEPGQPISFMAKHGAKVILDGTDPIEVPWTSEDGRIFRTPLDRATEQVFYQGKAMTLARWPNMTFDENWDDAKKWGRTGEGSDRGVVMSPELAALGKSLTGAQLWIKLGKGNNTFSRTILAHVVGKRALHWDDKDFYDNQRLTGEDGRTDRLKSFGFQDNRYFVANHPALLDAPEEWYYDAKAKELVFVPPDGNAPAPGEVRVKRRTFGFTGDSIEHVIIEGIDYFGCSISITKARHLTLFNSKFRSPYELLTMHDNQQVKADQRPIYIQGEHCLVHKCLVRYAPGTSIHVAGRANRIENCVVTEGSRHGRHGDPNVVLEYDRKSVRPNAGKDGMAQRWAYTTEAGNKIARCTIYNGSGIGIYLPGAGPGTAEYNHVFNVGQYCSDVSALYIPQGNERQWTGFHHNWIHDINGIGLRCDQDGQQVLIHHNVVWNCKAGGKANGFDFRIFHNTIFVDNPKHAFLLVKQQQLKVVADWAVQNNAVFRLADRIDLREYRRMSNDEKAKRDFVIDIPESSTIHHNHIITPKAQAELFINPGEAAPDLRPAAAGALVDAGTPISGINDAFHGPSPDIGAYEHGGEYWTAGATWWPEGQAPPNTMAEATQRAHAMTEGRRLYREDNEDYGVQ